MEANLKKEDFKILFMGTPSFAKTMLESVVLDGFNVVGVFCAPDRPSGRHLVIQSGEVEAYAKEKNIPVFQPQKLRETETILNILNQIKPNLLVVASYGKIIPKYVLDYPKYGAINVHPSLLPKYRGPSPIQSAIISGDTKTGVAIMYMDENMDTGNVIEINEIEIDDKDTYGTLHDKLAILGAEMLVCNLNRLAFTEDGILKSHVQPEGESICQMLNKENTKIDFNTNAETVVNLVKGLNPEPSAWCKIDDVRVYKIYETEKIDFEENRKAEVGEIIYLNDRQKMFVVKCKEGYVNITSIKAPGKRVMTGAEYIRGRGIKEGEIFN